MLSLKSVCALNLLHDICWRNTPGTFSLESPDPLSCSSSSEQKARRIRIMRFLHYGCDDFFSPVGCQRCPVVCLHRQSGRVVSLQAVAPLLPRLIAPLLPRLSVRRHIWRPAGGRRRPAANTGQPSGGDTRPDNGLGAPTAYFQLRPARRQVPDSSRIARRQCSDAQIPSGALRTAPRLRPDTGPCDVADWTLH